MREIGILWENATLQYLRNAGLTPVTRNYSCRYGEIDLIMIDNSRNEPDCTVFVEVRYRHSSVRGDGLASVGPAKRRKLLRTAAVYLQENPRLANLPCRFDVVACDGTPQQPSFDWVRSAFEAT
ncbi:MAG TPA: YraN family protein [Rudaea sp.]|nr:YraN family protein [Rudaea sp.]